MPTQERGTRPARALPYVLHANGRIDAANGRYWIDFSCSGGAAAVFQVYARNRTDGPWRYTVESGKSLSDYWSAVAYSHGLYDLQAHGPNGFLRHFQGSIPAATAPGAANPEVHASYDAAGSRVFLTIGNSGSAVCTVTVVDNAYALGAPRTHTLGPGASVQDVWSLSASGNWYDFSITTSGMSGWLRRYAGHIENGRASFSDPAMTAA